MKLFSKYLVKEFARLFLLCEGIFVFLYLIIDFLQKIDNFIEAKASVGVAVSYFIYKSPLILVQMVPPAALIAAIIHFSAMKKTNEITSIKASGVNILKFVRPILILLFLMGLGVFIFSETVVPYASSKGNNLWKKTIEKENPGLFYGSDQIWYKKDNCIYWIRHFDSKKKTITGVTLYFFNDTFRLIKKVDAKNAVWQNGVWMAKDVTIQELKNEYAFSKSESLALPSMESPEQFMKSSKEPEEMGYRQLKRYAKQIKREGYDNRIYLVDMHMKTANPFVAFVIVLIGIPLALSIQRGGAPFAVALGVGICFLFVFSIGFFRSLGFIEMLPPAFSAWLPNLIFLFLGSYLMIHIKR